jgi:cation diffusion facilitator family transporter
MTRVTKQLSVQCLVTGLSNQKQIAARVALLGGLLVFALKLLGAWLTGSVGVLSDALESTVNIAAAIVTAWAIGIASRPPDKEHPYGHDKAESLSSLLEALLIGVAAALVITASLNRFSQPKILVFSSFGFLITVLASLINFTLGRYLVGAGKRLHSPALEADGQHVLADVITSIGVLFGALLATWTRISWLDPALALGVGALLLLTAARLVQQNLNLLMDAALKPVELEKLQGVFEKQDHLYLETHNLRTRLSGSRSFVDFHLILPSNLSVLEAHQRCDQLENQILVALPNASVTIHVEPEEFLQGEYPDMQMAKRDKNSSVTL